MQGVGRSLGSQHPKGKRKVAMPKHPGPQPKKRMSATERAEHMCEMTRRREGTRERQKMDAQIQKLAPTVQNARGHSRSFESNMMFLTLFCSLYVETAETMGE